METTNTNIPQPYNKAIAKMQFSPGTKCVFSTSGDKTAWTIDTIYIDPKQFDFTGINKKTIEDRFKLADEADLETSKRHKLVSTANND